jgi:hypothetical protein
MENWEIVSIESELDRLRDEKENLEATGKKSGCGKVLLYFVLGILIVRLFGELLFLFK